jgi:acetyltransferase-like isoleucine patch superfamily enzyme
MIHQALMTPWKLINEISRLAAYPAARLLFLFYGIPWGKGWKLFGCPIIQKHKNSQIRFGKNLQLRSTVSANPLGANHAIILCTWQEGACLTIGDNFGMTGGTICAADSISIGDNVAVGANSTIVDTDFHPLEADNRRADSASANNAAVVIEDDVFIGMNCLILKGVQIGKGTVIGAGSVVTRSIPPGVIAAGNPARVIRSIQPPVSE